MTVSRRWRVLKFLDMYMDGWEKLFSSHPLLEERIAVFGGNLKNLNGVIS